MRGYRRLLMWLALLLPLTATADTPRIAIIIDDIGYQRTLGERSIKLHPNITLAVIPRSPHGPALAERADAAGREVMIHLPMTGSFSSLLDPGGLHPGMAPEEMATVIREAFELVPQAVGLNNHMGSELTADPEAMHWLMHELASHQVFFLDSRTTPRSVAEQAARSQGLSTSGRDVFLDNDRDLLDINTQFNTLLRIARQRGQAIAIGHPYPETLEYLEYVIPLLPEAGFELVPASALMPEAPLYMARKPTDEPEREEEQPQSGG